jgi:hypothetical protein
MSNNNANAQTRAGPRSSTTPFSFRPEIARELASIRKRAGEIHVRGEALNLLPVTTP